MEQRNGHTAEHILSAALGRFASRGYAGTSVQEIVDAARVTKPVLYYHFGNKAGLYQALVESAHDERYRLMQEAAVRVKDPLGQLLEIVTALFEFTRRNRELMRVAFATAFASPDQVPPGLDYLGRCQRNFEFVHRLIRRGQRCGHLDRRLASRELAFGFHGLMNVYVMAHVVVPDCRLDRRTAERVVRLFLEGAASPGTARKQSSRGRKQA